MLNSFNCNNKYEIALPIFQPLRLWGSSLRKENFGNEKKVQKREKNKKYKEAISLKVGFIEDNKGEERMVIAGRIFKY